MKTRKQYMANEVTHEQYYGQFVTQYISGVVESRLGKAIINSSDPHLNDIPLQKWDSLPIHTQETINAIRSAGDHPSKAGFVCIAKAAARQLKSGNLGNAGQ